MLIIQRFYFTFASSNMTFLKEYVSLCSRAQVQRKIKLNSTFKALFIDGDHSQKIKATLEIKLRPGFKACCLTLLSCGTLKKMPHMAISPVVNYESVCENVGQGDG